MGFPVVLLVVFVSPLVSASVAEPRSSVPVTMVVPNGFDSAPGNRGSGAAFDGNHSFLQVYSSSQFAPLLDGGLINAVSFRADESLGGRFDVNFSHFTVQIATYPYPFSFLDQISGISQSGLPTAIFPDAATAFSADNVRLSGRSSTSAVVPAPFDIRIPFDKPFHYDPAAGDLIILFLTGNAMVGPGAGALADFHLPTLPGFPGIASNDGEKSQNMGYVLQFGAQAVPEPGFNCLFAFGLVTILLVSYGSRTRYS